MNNLRKHLTVSEDLHKKLKILAAETGIPMRHLAEQAISLLFAKYKPKTTENK